MPWDTDAVGRGLALPDLYLHAVQERSLAEALIPLLAAAWPRAVRRLASDLERFLPHIKDLALAKRIGAFTSGLRYEIDAYDGHVFLLSDDLELERALYHGTRQLPVVRPMELLVRYITETEALAALVFTCRKP